MLSSKESSSSSWQDVPSGSVLTVEDAKLLQKFLAEGPCLPWFTPQAQRRLICLISSLLFIQSQSSTLDRSAIQFVLAWDHFRYLEVAIVVLSNV